MTDFTYPDYRENRDAMLRCIAYGYAQRGITAEIKPGSDHFIRADAYAKRITIAIANGQLGNTARDPLEAQGEDLLNLASVFGITPRPAAKADGFITIGATAGSSFSIPASFKATGPNGLKYQTIAPNLAVSNGSQIEMQAVLSGTSANLAAGVKLTWDSGSIGFLNRIATISVGGIDGGTDEDSIEVVRQRLIDRLSFPLSGGNWSQVKAWAEESSSAVSVAFVYSALRGPASYDVAIAGSTGDGTLSASFRAQTKSYILGQMPGHADINVTTIDNQDVDIVLKATLALPKIVGGAGGGWRDGTPWPAQDVKITSFASNVATVNGSTAPVVGNHIALWDANIGMREYIIASVSGSGPWNITVQGGFYGDPTGYYVSAGAVRLLEYITTARAQYESLGPGEKTISSLVLPRALRMPSTDIAYPSDLTQVQISNVLRTYPEIGNLEYSLRVVSGTSTPITTPGLPAAPADAPLRFRINQIAIRKA